MPAAIGVPKWSPIQELSLAKVKCSNGNWCIQNGTAYYNGTYFKWIRVDKSGQTFAPLEDRLHVLHRTGHGLRQRVRGVLEQRGRHRGRRFGLSLFFLDFGLDFLFLNVFGLGSFGDKGRRGRPGLLLEQRAVALTVFVPASLLLIAAALHDEVAQAQVGRAPRVRGPGMQRPKISDSLN